MAYRQLTLEYALANQPMTRTRDRSTSIEAAQMSGFKSSAGRLLALRTLAAHSAGLTDFELAAITRTFQQSIGKRRGECMKFGLVEIALDEHGQPIKRPAPSGAPALVWRITQAGLTYLSEHQI